MASVGSILSGSPAKINADLIPAAVVVDSINTLVGDVTLAAGTGISIPAAVGQTITVTNSGVTSLVAGANIQVSGATGAVTVSSGPQAITDDSLETLPGGVLVNTAYTPMTQTLTVPAGAAGMYLMECTVTFANTNPGDAVVWGADDYIELGIPTKRFVALKPWSNASSPDVWSISSSAVVQLNAGVYTPQYRVAISSGSTTPAGEPNLSVVITKL